MHSTPFVASSLLAIAIAACSGNSPPGSSGSPGPATPALAGDWRCAIASAVPVRPKATQLPIPVAGQSFTVHLHEAYSYAVLQGLDVTACDALDAGCVSPIAHAHEDDMGLGSYTLSLPGGLAAFDGYLAIAGPEMPDNYAFLAGRVPPYGSEEVDLAVYTAVALGVTADLAGVTLDPRHGLVRVEAHDCSNAPAAGVGIALEPQPAGPVEYFVRGGAALSRDPGATDVTGVALVLGAWPGAINVTGNVAGSPVGTSRGLAVAGAVTSVVLRPGGGHGR